MPEISASGLRRFSFMSLARALSGETYTAYIRSSSLPWSASNISSLRMERNAVSVLPEPVGDETSTFFLECMSGTAMACASVTSPNLSLNHSETTGCINDRTSSVDALISALAII